MDKTLQIVVVAAVIMMAAAIIMFLLTGKVGGIGDFVGNKTHGASCQIKHTQFVSNLYCGCDQPNDKANGKRGDCPGDGDDQWPDKQYNNRGDLASQCPSYEWHDISKLCG